MSEQSNNTHFGLNDAEYDNLMQAIRYGVIIVVTVLITFLIVSSIANLVGYVPPTRGDVSAEATQETSFLMPIEQLIF